MPCPALADIRGKHLQTVVNLIGEEYFNALNNSEKIKLLLDSNHFVTLGASCAVADLEASSRHYVFSIHCKRTTLLKDYNTALTTS